MADGAYDVDELVKAFKEFAPSGCMSTKECGKLVKAAWGTPMSNAGDIAFSKVKTKGKNTMNVDAATVGSFVKLMAQDYDRLKQPNPKKQNTETLLAEKVVANKGKATAETKKTSATGGVDRLTDTSKYTGSHKERFDDSGKGKGKGGRVDEAKNTGYVGNYKGEGSYAKK